MTNVPITTHPLTLDNRVALICNEARPAWRNAESLKGREGLEYRTGPVMAFEAGVRAAIAVCDAEKRAIREALEAVQAETLLPGHLGELVEAALHD